MTNEQPLPISVPAFQANIKAIQTELRKVIVGQDDLIRQVLIAIIGGGHVLLEGVPGLGKTLLIRTLGQTLDLEFNRIQFTPDLMPADILGTEILQEDGQGGRALRFRPGPIFVNLLMADEINRATPKTQSALLEAMQEKTVSVAGQSHVLQKPFFVLATQNPLEMEGTYTLPEAQLDRFMFKLNVKFPSMSELVEIIDRTTQAELAPPNRATSGETLVKMGQLARQIPLASHVKQYVARLLLATHPDQPNAPEVVQRFVRFGASPRGAQAIVLGAKASALFNNRYNVAFMDIHAVVYDALRHRLILNFEAEAEGVQPDEIIRDILEAIPTNDV